MSYVAKTNWLLDDVVLPADMNRIEQGISDADVALSEHLLNLLNPHGTTKAQVGLSEVANYGVASQAQAEAGTVSDKYMTPARTKQAIDALQAVKSVAGKTGTVALTKSDVGLSNVDNTSDASKPISTAVQTALNSKQTGLRSVNGQNMNNIKDTGFYQGYNMTNAAIATISAFIVIQYSPDWIIQIQYIIDGTSPEIHTRTFYGGTTWSAWKKYFGQNDVVPIANGGTGQTTLALARNAMGLGNTTGALPIANGGTAATTVAAAQANLGLTGTSNTTHYHDSRYIQTRIYNGEFQYYDGGWKSVGAVKSVQTGYAQVGSASYITGTGEDLRYVDVTISAVNINKCQIYGSGGFGTNASIAFKKSAGVNDSYEASMRLTSSTNLRIAVPAQYDINLLALRWTVIEYT